MCSGVGACRKKLAGTMCPSYMATREESDTTRGRANVLRLAMSGQLGESGLGDEGVYQVLDLCLECRACKSECPVGVDMARFKSEFLAGYPCSPRNSSTRPGAGECSSAFGMGQPLRSRFELDCPEFASPLDRMKNCWISTPAAALPAVEAGHLRALADAPSPPCRRRRRNPVQRHLHQSLRSRDRHRRRRNPRTRRLPRECGPAGVLRTPVDLARNAGGSAGACLGDGRSPIPHRQTRRVDSVLRTELLIRRQRGSPLPIARRCPEEWRER